VRLLLVAAACALVFIPPEADQDAQELDEEAFEIGFSLGLMAFAPVSIWWDRFRRIEQVQRFAALESWQPWTVAAAIFAGLVFASTFLGSGGLATALAGFVVMLGLGIPVILLGARHSLRVQRKERRSLGAGRRVPLGARLAFAGILVALGAYQLIEASKMT
jgi:hypothetical protein